MKISFITVLSPHSFKSEDGTLSCIDCSSMIEIKFSLDNSCTNNAECQNKLYCSTLFCSMLTLLKLFGDKILEMILSLVVEKEYKV